MAKTKNISEAADLALSIENGADLKDQVRNIRINLIETNPNQPRTHFDQTALEELAASIKNYGVIQPILVAEAEDGGFELVAGERRLRASKIAGLTSIPCIVKKFSESDRAEIALIENLQREDLNPVEEAKAYRSLMDKFGLTQEELAVKLGKSRPAIANSLRLLTLNPVVLDLVERGRLSAGHARALAVIKDYSVQASYGIAAADKKMSVRQLERMVASYLNPKKERKIFNSPELKELVNNMQHTFGTKVKAIGNNDKGRIYIDYYTKDDLIRIFELVEEVGGKN